MTEGGGSTLKWHKMMNVERAHLAVLHSWTAEGDFVTGHHFLFSTPENRNTRAAQPKSTCFSAPGSGGVSNQVTGKQTTGTLLGPRLWVFLTPSAHFAGPSRAPELGLWSPPHLASLSLSGGPSCSVGNSPFIWFSL